MWLDSIQEVTDLYGLPNITRLKIARVKLAGPARSWARCHQFADSTFNGSCRTGMASPRPLSLPAWSAACSTPMSLSGILQTVTCKTLQGQDVRKMQPLSTTSHRGCCLSSRAKWPGSALTVSRPLFTSATFGPTCLPCLTKTGATQRPHRLPTMLEPCGRDGLIVCVECYSCGVITGGVCKTQWPEENE